MQQLYVLIVLAVYSVSGGPPAFIQQPNDTVAVNGKLILNCFAGAGAAPPPYISWYRGNPPLLLNAFNGLSILNITNITAGVDASAAGTQYYCSASNSYGTIRSRTASAFIPVFNGFQGESTNVVVTVENTTVPSHADTVALYCNISRAYPPPAIVWVNDLGQTVPNDGVKYVYIEDGRYLVITNTGTSLAQRSFHCRVTNVLGSSSSVDSRLLYTFNLSVYSSTLLFIYKPLEDVTAYDGDTNVKFSIVAASLGMTSIQYSITSTPAGSSLTVGPINIQNTVVGVIAGPLSVNDNGTTVMCSVIYGVPAMVATYTATLTMLAAPVLISSPNNSLYNLQGDSASFTCAYNVAMGITLSWYMNGALLTNTSHVQISGSSLSISALYANDSGMYQCSVSNGTNSVWGQWAVNVRVPQLIALPPSQAILVVMRSGNNATLTFQVRADPPPSGVQWYFNSSLIQTNTTYQISNIIAADNSTGSITYNTSLVIDYVDNTTQGYYLASFSNRAGVTNTTPVFVTPSVNASIVSFTATPPCVTLGSTIQLVCTTYGYPIPTVTFLVLNSRIPPNPRITQTQNTLTITNIAQTDVQIYSCQIAGGFKVDLALITCPTVGQPSGPVPVGGSATITCQTSSTNIIWYKNGATINTNTGPSFILSAAQTTDSGTYWCSGDGIKSNNVTISVADCPSFTINYPSMRTLLCPGDTITYTCTFATSNTCTGFIITQWSGSAFQCPSSTPSPNLITLSQTTAQPLNPTVVSCGNLSAVMTSVSGICYTSVLTIPTPQYYNGTTVQCVDTSLNTVGSDTLNVQLVSPPSAPTITSLIINYPNITVTWTSVLTATSYNVSINGSSPISLPANATTYTFTGQNKSTPYIVSVVAINCAGSSSSGHFYYSPDIIPATNCSHDNHISTNRHLRQVTERQLEVFQP